MADTAPTSVGEHGISPSNCAFPIDVGNASINGGQQDEVFESEDASKSLAIVPYKEYRIVKEEQFRQDFPSEVQRAILPFSHGEQCQGQDDDDTGKDGWEAARAWLWTLPKRRNVMWEEVEAWLQTNRHRLSREIVTMPRAHLFRYLVSQHKLMRRAQQGEKVELVEPPTARFKRSDKWRPVYAWLESLDTIHVVGAKVIDEWLAKNPALKRELQSKHTRHHLFHYIQKCHSGILKKKTKQGSNGIVEEKKKVRDMSKNNLQLVPGERSGVAYTPIFFNDRDNLKQSSAKSQLEDRQGSTTLAYSMQGMQPSDGQAKQTCAFVHSFHENQTERPFLHNDFLSNDATGSLGMKEKEQQTIAASSHEVQMHSNGFIDPVQTQDSQATNMQLIAVVESSVKPSFVVGEIGSNLDKSEARRRYEILAELQTQLWQVIVCSREQMTRASTQDYLSLTDRPSTSASPFPSMQIDDFQNRPGSSGNAFGALLDGQTSPQNEEFEGRTRRRLRDSGRTQQETMGSTFAGQLRLISLESKSRKKRRKGKENMDNAIHFWSFSEVSLGLATSATGCSNRDAKDGVLGVNIREQFSSNLDRATSQNMAGDATEWHSASNIVRYLDTREKGAGIGSQPHPFTMVGRRSRRRWKPFLEGWDSIEKQFIGGAVWLQRKAYSTWLPCWSAYTSSVAVAAPLGMMDQGVQKVLDVRFHPESLPQLVCSSNAAPNELLLYNLVSGRATELAGHNCQIQAVEYAANGARIVSCGSNLVKIWDSSLGTCLHTLGPRPEVENSAGHKKKINAMAVNPTQSCLVATSGGEGDSQLLLWNVQAGELVHDLNGSLREKHAVLPCMDAMEFCNQNLLICGSDSASGGPAVVQLWDADATQDCTSFPAHDSYITCLKTDPSGKTLLTGAGDGTVALFDIRSCGGIARLPLGSNCEITSVSFSCCGTYFQASSTANSTLVWDIRVLPMEPGPMPSLRPLESVFSASRKMKALHRLSHGTPMPTSENAGQLPGFVDEGDQGINDARWFHNMAVLVTVSGNGSTAMWDVSLGQPCVRHLISHSRCINTVAIAPNDKYICSGGDDQKVVLYQSKSEKSIGGWRLTHPLCDDSQTI